MHSHFPRAVRLAVLLIAATGLGAQGAAATPASYADFQAAAVRSNSVLVLPVYPVTPDEIKALAENSIKTADVALEALAAQNPAKLTFANTIEAYDRITAKVVEASMTIGTIAQSSVDKTMRDTANDVSLKLDDWGVALDYREGIYHALKAFADTKPTLDREQQRLVDDTMRGYRRAGLALPAAERAEVERLRKDLSALTTQFAVNINEARGPIDFTAEELAGVPASFLESPGVKQPDGRYRVMTNITWHAVTIMESASSEETRKKTSAVRTRLAMEKNVPVLAKLVALRADLAHRLGYANWADYQTETRMAKTGAAALKFEEDLVAGLQPKFDAEVKILQQLKAKETGQADAKLESWDVGYYQNQLKKQRYAVDTEALRVYFPYQASLEGMFAIYQKIFSLKFTEVKAPYVWAEGVQLYIVQDATTGNPMGAFYLDMFPREGKYNHFACFGQNVGGPNAAGHYVLPVAALMCNFPAPSPDKPSLLKHEDVRTLFHEFGHVMHKMLSRSRFAAQGSFSVPRDFVEAPSQMLENWIWDKTVLDTFAADYRDPSKKIPADTISALVAARQATDGYFNRGQLAIGLLDLKLHTLSADEAWLADVVELTNGVTARVTLPPPAGSARAAYIGHLAGYDAGYYGYLWAQVMAIDMASVFEAAPGGYLDEKIGRRLRDEVYAKGDTRDVAESVEKFLGRPRSQEPFLKYIGIGK